ncbi:MAG: undecaprenyl-diphosphate phosphatase [bacterium]|nr:undecaprenyl-diphosphate phosphatase [bacterium]
MEILEILKIIVLGLLEGITEWIPISSTGHLILIEELIPLNQSQAFVEMFEVVVQLGAILAVAVLYCKPLNPFDAKKSPRQKRKTYRLWLKILLAALPVGIIGFLLDDWLHEYLFQPWVIAVTLILYGVLFLVLERYNENRRAPIQRVGQIRFQTAGLIGLIQLLALVPGTSRSGVTILGAMVIGCSRPVAAEFSFFVGIPVMLAASILEVAKYIAGGSVFTGMQVFYIILGMAVAFVVSIYSIKFLITYIKQNNFRIFGYYRIGLGIIVLIFFGVKALVSIRA